MLGGWHPPVVAELGMMAALTAVALGFAGYRFSRTS
jgi:ABC-2 type transport system permease protein